MFSIPINEVENLNTFEYFSAFEQAMNLRRFIREPQFDKQGNVINNFDFETRRDKINRVKRELKKRG